MWRSKIEAITMSSNGRYVRAPIDSDNESTDDDYDLDNSSEPAVQEEERESDFSSDESSSNRSRSNEPNDAVNSSNRRGSVDPVSSPKMVSTDDRLQRMENALADITKALNVLQTPVAPNKDTDQIWSNPTALTSTPDIIPSSVRWDNIKPFPTRVAANKMWQEWNHYIENFETLRLSITPMIPSEEHSCYFSRLVRNYKVLSEQQSYDQVAFSSTTSKITSEQ